MRCMFGTSRQQFLTTTLVKIFRELRLLAVALLLLFCTSVRKRSVVVNMEKRLELSSLGTRVRSSAYGRTIAISIPVTAYSFGFSFLPFNVFIRFLL